MPGSGKCTPASVRKPIWGFLTYYAAFGQGVSIWYTPAMRKAEFLWIYLMERGISIRHGTECVDLIYLLWVWLVIPVLVRNETYSTPDHPHPSLPPSMGKEF